MTINKNTQARILFHNADFTGGGYYRMFTPAEVLKQQNYAVTLTHQYTYDAEGIKTLAPDAIVFQHPVTDEEIMRVRSYKKHAPDVFRVLEIDDAFWEVPKESAHYAALPQDIKLRIVTGANLCNAAVVTTQPLADLLRKETTIKDIRVLPNMLTRDVLKRMTTVRRQNNKEHPLPRVGWVGGAGHGGDLAVIAPIVAAMKNEVRFVFMGMLPDGVNPADVELHEAVPIHAYHEKLASLDLDIALAPLAQNVFNECKSNLRILEYGAAGFAVLAGHITPYNNFPHVAHCGFSPEAWMQSIRNLIARPDHREKLAESLHKYVNENYCLEDHAAEVLAAYAPKGAVFHTPRPATTEYADVVTTVSLPSAVDAPVLWIEDGVEYLNTDIDALAHSKSASTCLLSNDGLYPTAGQHVTLQPSIVDAIRIAAEACGNTPTIAVPYPTGPAVLLSRNAIRAIGLPDTERFKDRSAALMDWGVRAHKAGLTHDLCVASYAYSPNHTHDSDKGSVAVQAWHPDFGATLGEFKHQEQINFACQNIEFVFTKNVYKHPVTNQRYSDWHNVFSALTPADKDRMRDAAESWEHKPLISVIMPVYDAPLDELRAAVKSVKDQIYTNWELIIVDDASTNPAIVSSIGFLMEDEPRIKFKRRESNGHICAASNDALEMASGDWMVCLDHDDLLEPHALYAVAESIVTNPSLQFIYSDSDKISPEGQFIEPYFVPDFDYDLLLGQNYVTHLSAYPLQSVKDIGGYRLGLEGSQDWDMTLRHLAHTCGFPFNRDAIRHIPHVLYHWRQSENSASVNIMAKPYALAAGRRAVMDHLKAVGQDAVIMPHPLVPSFQLVRNILPKEQPRVSIIIQTRDNPEQLGRCINSIVARTAYNNYEILVMDNGWKKTALKEVKDASKVTLIPNPGEFNYAEANNRGAEAATGNVLCFLNDDTEIVEDVWLLDMVGAAVRSWTGAVGPRLIYRDGSVQQGGTIIDMSAPVGQKAIHAFQKNPLQDPGIAGRGVLAAERSAVTGACMVIEKAKYLAVGGMDAINFPRDYNDVDLCLRLVEAGYFNAYLGHILVLHDEAQTKKKWPKTYTPEALAESDALLLEKHGGFVDPYINPNTAFHHNLNQLMPSPALLPWAASEIKERVLVINAGHEEAVAYYQDGVLAYGGVLNGHSFGITYPRLSRMQPMDTRDAPADLMFALSQLGITKAILNGLGDGTYGALGWLGAAEQYGIDVEYHWLPGAKEEMIPDAVKAYMWAVAKKMDPNDSQTA